MKSRLTFANVTSVVALFIALGGVSWAATTLPANSVGTVQVQDKAITSAKLADRAVTQTKLDPAVVTLFKGQKGDTGPTGARGLQGLPGAAGAKGDQGIQGAKGDQGIQGLTGAKGDKGDKGDSGIAGQVIVAYLNIMWNGSVVNHLDLVRGAHVTNLDTPPGQDRVPRITFDRELTGCVGRTDNASVDGVTGATSIVLNPASNRIWETTLLGNHATLDIPNWFNVVQGLTVYSATVAITIICPS